MKNLIKFILSVVAVIFLIWACNSNDDVEQMMNDDDVAMSDDVDPTDDGPIDGSFEMVDVTVILPNNSDIDLNATSIVSLGNIESIDADGMGMVAVNPGTIETAYLIDNDNNVLLAGFISDDRQEISIRTTVELMLYYGLDYYLLPDNAKTAFLNTVAQTPNFDSLVSSIEVLFEENALMYAEGTYIDVLNQAINGLTGGVDTTIVPIRIFLDDVLEKSGVTFSKLDESSINLTNTLPRRSRILVYRMSSFDRQGNLTEIPNFRENEPIINMAFDPATSTISDFAIGNRISEINANAAAVENARESGPINLPINVATEFAVQYEVVIIGSGTSSDVVRDFTGAEQEIYEEINEETYILDFFLPTLLDIGGNKSLLENLDDATEQALLNEVQSILESYSDVRESIRNNEFKDASESWLPELYDNIRLSDDLRNMLGGIYNVLSNNGNSPNTFIQSQELIEEGIERTERVMEAIFQNMDFRSKTNLGQLRTTAKILEQWQPYSTDAEVGITATNTEVCLGEAQELRATLLTVSDPEVETLEYHWSSSNRFGGQIQDINGVPNNFGAEIVTETNVVSYISAALESDLGSGANTETITVTIMARNIRRNDLTEIGNAAIDINNSICESFIVSFVPDMHIRELEDNGCPDGIEYRVDSPLNYNADFEAVDGATGYLGAVTNANGDVGNQFTLENLQDLGNGMLRVNFATGPFITGFRTCNLENAEAQLEEFLSNIIEPVSIEITPAFN